MIFQTPLSMWSANLNAQTAFLEACDWDESIRDQLLNELAIILIEASRHRHPLTRKVLAEVCARLVPDSTDQQIDTLVDLIRTEIRTADTEVEA